MKCFLTYLIFKNLWNNHWHVVLCTSLKSRRERWGCAFLSMGGKICCQNSFLKQPSLPPKAFHFHCSLKLICLLWCLSPDRRSLVFAVQQFCALESGSFLLAKGYCEHWKVCWSYAAWITKSKPGGLGCTYIYLGFTSTRANHIQLLYG